MYDLYNIKTFFQISSWIFVVSDVQIGGSESSINMDLYEENGEWDLKGSAVENKTRYPCVYCNILSDVNTKFPFPLY